MGRLLSRRARVLRRLAAVAALGLLGAAVATGWPVAEGPVVDPLPLTLPDATTTVALARVSEGTLLLREVSEQAVEGVLVPGDPIGVYAEHGLAGLRALRDRGDPVSRRLDDLLPPVASPPPHIGAGNNFADHQDEVAVHDAPALFPKMATPTPWNAPIPAATRLDWEVELCGVTLAPIAAHGPVPLGFVLCHDSTDRWSMLTGIERGTPWGTTGFPDGKGGPGRLPVGPWMVIADDAQAFAESVRLRLTVNGRVRQQAAQSLAVWGPHRIVREAFDSCGLDFRYRGEAVDWPACDELPAGTLILGGTPGGVAFRLWNVWAPWLYLHPGDVVVAEGSGLGRQVNRVSGPGSSAW